MDAFKCLKTPGCIKVRESLVRLEKSGESQNPGQVILSSAEHVLFPDY